MADVPRTSATSEGRYNARAVVDAFATYRDPAARASRLRRRVTAGNHPYTGEQNFRVHRAVLDAHMPAAGTILEVGPGGAGNYTTHLARRGRTLIAGDISPEQLRELARRLQRHRHGARVTTLEMDVVSIPLADESADAVVCIGGVISYVLDAAATAMGEIHRVLRPGGRAVVSVMTPGWISSPDMGYRTTLTGERYAQLLDSGDVLAPEFERTDHRYRCYTADRLGALVVGAGFAVADMLASHLDGVPSSVPLSAYMAACRHAGALDTTRGYLIAVLEKP